MSGQKGIQFVSASSQYATSGNISVGLTFSLSCWMKTLVSTSGIFRAVCDLENSLNTLGVRLGLQNNHIYVALDGGSSLEGAINIQDGMWHHMVWVFDGTNMKMYVDNVADGSASGIPTAITAIATLGKDINNTTYSDISLKEVIVWDHNLTTTEISTDYNSGAGTFNTSSTGKLAGWHLDNAATDFVGSNDLTLTGSPGYVNAIVALDTTGATQYTLQYGISSYTGTKDAHMTQFNPAFNTGGNSFFEVFNYQASSNESTPILYDDILSLAINSGYTIIAAWYELTVQGTRNGTPSKQFAVYYVKRAWNEGSGTGVDGQTASTGDVTWNSAKNGQQTWTTAGCGDTTNDRDNTKQDELRSIHTTAGNVYKVTVTDFVQLVNNGTITNNGIVLVRTTDYATNATLDFYSRNDSTNSHHPKLVIWAKAPGTNYTKTLTETAITSTETIVKSPAREFDDVISNTDTIVKAAVRTLLDSTTTSEALEKDITRILTEAGITNSEAFVKLKGKNYTDSSPLVETIQRNFTRVLTEAIVNAVDYLGTHGVYREFDDAIISVETIQKSYSTEKDDSIANSESYTNLKGKNYTDNSTVLEVFNKSTAKIFNENLSNTEFIQKAFSTLKTDSLTAIEIISKSTGMLLSESIVLVDTRSLFSSKFFTENSSLTEAIIKSIGKPFNESSTLLETFIKQATLYRVMSDNSIISETLSKNPSKIFLESSGLIENFKRSFSKTWKEVISNIEMFGIQFVFIRNLSDTIKLIDDILNSKSSGIQGRWFTQLANIWFRRNALD